MSLVRSRLASLAANKAHTGDTSISRIHLGESKDHQIQKLLKPNWDPYLYTTFTGDNKLCSCYVVLK